MNAAKIEAAISELAFQAFDAAEFPFAFLAAFGNKDTTLKRLRTGNFRVINIKVSERDHVQPRLPNWTNGFPCVNGGLFSGPTCVPCFTRMARTYLMHAGNLNWKQINPAIFGSMIQAVADDEQWFLVPLHVMDEAVWRIRDGSITAALHDPGTAQLVGQGIGLAAFAPPRAKTG